MFSLIVVVLLTGLMLFVRFAPQDVAKFHLPPNVLKDELLKGGVKRAVPGEMDALHRVILQEPRTKLAAGSVAENLATYVTRSRFWGFPDYTTVYSEGEQLQIHARLVFGRSDFGVNAARVDRWINALPAD